MRQIDIFFIISDNVFVRVVNLNLNLKLFLLQKSKQKQFRLFQKKGHFI